MLNILSMADVAAKMGLENPDSRNSRLRAIYLIRKLQTQRGVEHLMRCGNQLKITEEHLKFLLIGNDIPRDALLDMIEENKYQIAELKKQVEALINGRTS